MTEPNFVENCIDQIRKSNYGLDMRKPLADGLEGIVDYLQREGIQIEGVLTGTSLTQLQNEDYKLNIMTS